MYHEHFGLAQAPFRITPQTEYFYSGAQRGPLLEALLFAVNHDEGIVRVSGEVGTGKTMLCRMLIERLPSEALVIYLANPSLTPAELIATVAHELQLAPQTGHGLLRQIEHRLIELYGEGRRVIVIIDEAHAMPRESLDQIRLLSNLETGTRKLLQIVLFGQPELDAILDERAMRSLRERITQSFILKPLDRHQIGDYLHFRLRAAGYKGPDLFSGAILGKIARASKGLTRRVNIIADKTLLAAFADNTHTITDRHVNAAIRDANYHDPLPLRGILLGMGGAMLAAGAVALGSQWLATQTRKAETPTHPMQAAKPPAAVISSPPAVTPANRAILAQAIPQTAISRPSSDTAAAGTPLDERYAPVPEQLGPLARERLAASRADMASLAGDQWFLQLRSIPAANAASLESFLAAASKAVDPAQLRLFVVKGDARQTIGVIYGAYASAQEAYAARNKLPAWIRSGGTFARPYKALRADNKKAATAAASASSK